MTQHKHSNTSSRHPLAGRLSTIALVGSLLTIPIMAYGADAQETDGGEQVTHHRVHGRSGARFVHRLLVGADTDQDEKVSAAEWSSALNGIDTDSDGLLSREELEAHREALAAQSEDLRHRRGPRRGANGELELSVADLEARFEQMDRDGDGFLSAEDRPGPRAHRRRGGRRGPIPHLLRQADSNNDGSLTETEWTGFLATADSDTDGLLSRDELEALRPDDAPERGPHANDDHPGLEVTRLTEMFQRFDADDNGVIEEGEWRPAGRRGAHRRGRGAGLR